VYVAVDAKLTLDIVFDVPYVNGISLTRYPLSERRNALHRIINPIERRFEVHGFEKGNTVADIEKELRKIVAEGYVLVNAVLIY
jgi:DNA ligase 4